jgi:hypothetical protein
VELQGRSRDLLANGLGLAAISYDPIEVLADFASRRGITFPLLSDRDSATIKAYGLLNTTVASSNRVQYGIPFPGTFTLDRDARVTSRHFEAAYQERDTIASVLVRNGKQLDAQGKKIAAPLLELTVFASDRVVAPGTHFSLIIDAKPARKVHVYAPGVNGYTPVTLTVHPRSGVIARELLFPKPVDYFFKPLNEHVAVFDRPFRVVQDIALDASRDAEAAFKPGTELTIAATFEYQACDDKICFPPQSVPLSWTVLLKALDRERPSAR